MAKNDEKLNEASQTMDGCYGVQTTIEVVTKFLDTVFKMNAAIEGGGTGRFSSCIWGHAGIGKTDMIKSFENHPVTWGGKEYEGYRVIDVPIAQFEEMGDLHGIPMDCVRMTNNGDEQWVPQKDEVVRAYRENDWKIDTASKPRTFMAPPPWVPDKPGPSILLLDDWNRASIRIIKGIMQLLQNYGMVSWSLPLGCNIVLTGNPDEQDYLVTTIDQAILTRIKHVTLKEDASEWAVWAVANKIDNRLINWVLAYPEMMIGKERTNPRTLSEFGRFLNLVGSVESEREEVVLHAHSLLDEETVASMLVFFTREMEDIVEPEDVLEGKEKAFKHIENLMTKRKEARVDVVGITMERLYAHMVQPDCKQSPKRVKNFQRFITMGCIPEDMRHSVCRRIAKRRENRFNHWIIGDKKLKALIMDTLR